MYTSDGVRGLAGGFNIMHFDANSTADTDAGATGPDAEAACCGADAPEVVARAGLMDYSWVVQWASL